jgi:hypothetical protein
VLITSDLAGVVCQLSRLASRFISRPQAVSKYERPNQRQNRRGLPGSKLLLLASPTGNSSLTLISFQKIEDDLMVETQQYLPSKFECVACQLKIAGLSQLAACGLGDTYTATFTYDLADYYAPNDDYAGYEDDNNEP